MNTQETRYCTKLECGWSGPGSDCGVDPLQIRLRCPMCGFSVALHSPKAAWKMSVKPQEFEGQAHPVVATLIEPDKKSPVSDPSGAYPEPNKNLIWGDCPACAYKHLTAAYASLTSPLKALEADGRRSFDIQAARASIAYGEYKAGYIGNLALANGCLALAESLAACEKGDEYAEAHAKTCRETRLDIQAGREPDFWFIIEGAYGWAHLFEAAREYPDMRDKIEELTRTLWCDHLKEHYDELRLMIRELEETYMLGPEAPKVCGAEANLAKVEGGKDDI